MHFLIDHIGTPLGDAVVIDDEDGALRFFRWANENDDGWEPALRRRYPDVALVRRTDPFGHAVAIAAYMEGDVLAIDAVCVAFAGTAFQQSVWRALRTIPASTTESYAGLARCIGKPAAVRAVGRANGANPIGLVVPCHRVVGSDGTLTGYGGGLARKRWLLDHEARCRGPRGAREALGADARAD